MTEEESEYNLTHHTITTIQHTAIVQIAIAHPTTANRNKHQYPFIDDITKTPFPKQWETFTLERYDRDTYHDEHVKIYVTHLRLYSTEHAIIWRYHLQGTDPWMVYIPASLHLSIISTLYPRSSTPSSHEAASTKPPRYPSLVLGKKETIH